MSKSLIWLLAVLALTSCSKNLSRFNVDPDEFNVNRVNYQYISLRSKIKYEDDRNKQKAIANIRIKKDSIVWFSISPGLGVEALRGIITQDSIMLINKIKKEYVKSSIDSYTDNINFSYNLSFLESILVGNLIWKVGKRDDVRKVDDYYILEKKLDNLNVSNFISSSSMKLEQIIAASDTSSSSMRVKYSTFQEFSDRDIPTMIDIHINYPSPKDNTQKMSNITIEHSKVEIDKKHNFSFAIPKKYKRK